VTAANDEASPTLTVREVMARWKCARQSVLEAIHDGRLKAFRVGNKGKSAYRVTLSEVRRFEAAGDGVKAVAS
jgi:excisionase family DNA binding protein